MKFNDLKKKTMETIILISTLLFTIICCFFKLNFFTNLFAFLTLVVDIYSLIKYKKNPLIFIIFLCILYFDYSVIITKYFFNISEFKHLYAQIKYSTTMLIGISTVLDMHIISLLFLSKYECNELALNSDFFKYKNNNTSREKVFFMIITILIGLIILNNRCFHFINISDAVLEYTFILFVFSFYYCKDKLIKGVLIFLLALNCFFTLKIGGRIVIIEPILVFVLIFFSNKINIKNILICFVLGLGFFTLAGFYGDYLDSNKNYFKEESLSQSFNKIVDRKFALDTSYSSYWTGLTLIEMSNIDSTNNRLSDGLQYFLNYTIFGSSSDYQIPVYKSHNLYLHYFGGYLNSYFYYWFGFVGIIFIGIILGKFYKKILLLNDKSLGLEKISVIYFISSIPRWYLYNPTSLFRGYIILLLIYWFINKFVLGDKNENCSN